MHATDGTSRLMNIIDVNDQQLKERVHRNIMRYGIMFKKNRKWSNAHFTALLSFIHSRDWDYVNDERLELIVQYFDHKFDIDIIYKHTQSMGIPWR